MGDVMTEVVLAVDGGNTKTLASVVSDAGDVLALTRGGQSDIYGARSVEIAVTELTRTVEEALRTAGVRAEEVCFSVFSLAGADWPEDHEVLESELSDRLGLGRLIVVNDAIGGLRTGAPTWEGISVICGTFNAIGARHRDGRVFHLGFWPDRTGAFDLSTEALKAVYRAGLGLGPQTQLTEPALTLYGRSDPLDLLHYFTRRGHPGVETLMRMTPVLLEVADGGDEVAATIVHGAGRVMGDEARVAAERVGLGLDGTRVVLAGGVFNHPSKALEESVMARLPGAVAVRNGLPPIVGVTQLALDEVSVDVDQSSLAAAIAVFHDPDPIRYDTV
jgi:N-acetylglucosamine kinase-like BadF-type ATPase